VITGKVCFSVFNFGDFGNYGNFGNFFFIRVDSRLKGSLKRIVVCRHYSADGKMPQRKELSK